MLESIYAEQESWDPDAQLLSNGKNSCWASDFLPHSSLGKSAVPGLSRWVANNQMCPCQRQVRKKNGAEGLSNSTWNEGNGEDKV